MIMTIPQTEACFTVKKTATETAKANNNLVKIHNKLLLNVSCIPDEYKEIFITEYKKKYNTVSKMPLDNYDWIDYQETAETRPYTHTTTRKVSIDYMAQRTRVFTDKIAYTVVAIRDIRLSDFSAMDIYYNRAPSYFYGVDKLTRDYYMFNVEYQEETAA